MINNLRLGEIDLNKKVIKSELFLCKPNKDIIAKMNEAYGINFSSKLGSLNEINFKLPIFMDNKHKLVRNLNADIIKGRYLVKLVLGNYEEYFIINQIDKVGNKDEAIEVKTLSLGYELNDKIIRGYKASVDSEIANSRPKNAVELLKDMLQETIWKIGYVDSEFELKYRSFEVSSSTVLETIIDIAETFNALIVWDTINRKINFYKPDNVGEDKGFKIKYGKYLESLNQEDNSEEIITRLSMFGKEDISIHALNPTGTSYIEDLTYFVFPYSEVKNYSKASFSSTDIDLWNKYGNLNAWTVDADKMKQNDLVSESLIVSNDTSAKNYRITSTIRASNGNGSVGQVVRFQDINNYYFVEWKNYFVSPVLQALEVSFATAKATLVLNESNLSNAESDLYDSGNELIMIEDDRAVLQQRINDKMDEISKTSSTGGDTTLMKVALADFQNQLALKRIESDNKKAEIVTLHANIKTYKENIDKLKVDVTTLEIDIALERMNNPTTLLTLKKKVNGIESVVVSTSDVDGFSFNNDYKMSVEVDNERIKIWIDNRLVLEHKDSDLNIGAYGLIGNGVVFTSSQIDYEKKDYEVTGHSEYMSDELAHLIVGYTDLLDETKPTFSVLRGKLDTLSDINMIKSGELFELETDYKMLLDDRDILNTRIAVKEDDLNNADNAYQDKTLIRADLDVFRSTLKDVLADIQIKYSQISTKKSEIAVIEVDILDIDYQIEILKTILSVSNYFPKDMLDERNQFIVEKEWTESNIEDPEDLLKEGLEVFNEFREQKITLKIDIVNFLSMITEQINWDKLNLGDIFTIYHERFKIGYKAKVTEINYDFEGNKISLTISNIKDLYANKDKFLDMLYKSYNSSTQVNMDKWKWDLSMENKGSINQIINNIWDANKQAIVGAKDQVIEISDRGLIIRDPNNPMNYLVGLNSLLAITNDGGATFKHAITANGIVGERLYGKVIMGVNLAIEDEHGIVKWQGSKGEIFDRDGVLVMKLGLVEENPDAFGLISFNEITKVKVTDKEGFVIERATSDTTNWTDGWEKIFWADQNTGTLYSHDIMASNIKIVSDRDWSKEILNAETGYFDLGWFKNIVKDNKLTTDEKLTLITELNKIYSSYVTVLGQAIKYQKSNRDNSTNYNGAFNTNTQTFPTTPSTVDRFSTVPLKSAYVSLIEYMKQYVKITSINPHDPLAIDINDPMTEQTSEIVPDRATFILRFKEFYDELDKLRNSIEDALFYSGMNMGQYYNNLIMGDYGFIAVRNDGKYRAFLNATNGLALQTWENGAWVSKIYADMNGTLYADDLITQRLLVKGSAGEVFIDARIGLIDFSQFKTIVGQLRAENIYSNIITAEDGFIQDLVVNRVKTIDSAYASGGMEYVHIQENYIKFISATSTGTSGQAFDFNGNPLFWLDGTKEQRTFKNTGLPVMVESFDETEKMKLHFTDMDGESVPVIEMSVGGSGTSNMGYIYKTTKNMVMEYYNSASTLRRIRLRSEGTVIDNKDGNVVIMGGGFLVTGSGLDSGWNDQTYKTQGGVYIPSNGNGVYNSFEASGVKGARWKFDDNNYILQTADAINWYMGGKERIQLTTNSVKILADDNNYIIINNSGITMKGNAINMN